ncbi:ECF RNA polymerase sigma factor SigR [termite gut metagenome]|uniref:ECF RNA polymerase sigma factor SigR n=1 Tax=termite gut metagenome TaxID=433724 RepID=A0A5J4RTN6_9ZZZZ
MNTTVFHKNLLEVQNELLRFAYKLTADREDANDLLQETSLKALDYEGKYTPDTNFKVWMYTIIRNIFINNYRKEACKKTFVDRTESSFLLNSLQDTGDGDTEGSYSAKEIRHALKSLPSPLSTEIMMRVSGYKYSEIAEKLRLPLGTVKSNIFSTRLRLRKELKDFI